MQPLSSQRTWEVIKLRSLSLPGNVRTALAKAGRCSSHGLDGYIAGRTRRMFVTVPSLDCLAAWLVLCMPNARSPGFVAVRACAVHLARRIRSEPMQALFEASVDGHTETVQALLINGADVRGKDKDGYGS